MYSIGENGYIISQNEYSEVNIVDFVVPSHVKGIEKGAFKGNRTIKTIDFSKNTNITKIPEYAFSDCKKLEKIIFGNNIQVIGKNAFSGCNSLMNINLEMSKSKIPSGMPWGNPNGIKTINWLED